MEFNYPWIMFGSLMLAGLSYAVGAAFYIGRIELTCKQALDALHLLMAATIEKEVLKESKARHDLANHIHTEIASLDRDYRAVTDKVSVMVHKEDLYAVEGRLTASIDKLEQRLFSREAKND